MVRTATRNYSPARGLARIPLSMALLLALAGSVPAHAALTENEARRLADLSLEELMQVEVTSVAGMAQTRQAAPAAISVITAEDIRRTGHRSLAEALRLVPGMFVGRTNSSSWVIGSRGMTASAITANRYLVMIDGRIVHDPLLSTTFWDVNDVLLDDIERIEVIRGPGATLWGANAMNGVISVITRDTRDTRGTLARVGYGDQERGFVALRHGRGTAQEAWRFWSRFDRHGDFENAAGVSLEDQWSALRGGFRYDSGDVAGLHTTVWGEAYTLPEAHFAIQEPIPGVHQRTRRIEGQTDVSGGHAMLRLLHDADGAGWSLQAIVDHSERENVRLALSRDTLNLDFRRWARWGERNEWIWGANLYHTSSTTGESATVTFDPPDRTTRTLHAFAQNTTELVDERLFLMLGSKLTDHDYVGVHAQPAVRLWWVPDATQTLWAAVSRPVRVPSRLEDSGALIFGYFDTGLLAGRPATGVIVPLALRGNEDLPVEKLLAWELGYRIQPDPRWSIDVALYLNDYQRLISVPTTTFGEFNANGSGETHGIEVVANWQATDRWRLEGSASWIDIEIDGPVLQFEETSSPRRHAQLRSYLDLGADVELNAALYHVDEIERTAIDSYRRLDLGVTWRASRQLELALWGQNLLEDGHAENSGAQVPRGVYLQATVRLD